MSSAATLRSAENSRAAESPRTSSASRGGRSKNPPPQRASASELPVRQPARAAHTAPCRARRSIENVEPQPRIASSGSGSNEGRPTHETPPLAVAEAAGSEAGAVGVCRCRSDSREGAGPVSVSSVGVAANVRARAAQPAWNVGSVETARGLSRTSRTRSGDADSGAVGPVRGCTPAVRAALSEMHSARAAAPTSSREFPRRRRTARL